MSISIGGGSNNAVYDSVLDITWLANANLADSSTFGVGSIHIHTNGRMSWDKANEWITSMNTANYLGVKSWRQPQITFLNGSSINFTRTYDGSSDRGFQLSAPKGTNNPNGQSAGFAGSELAYHYYNNLGAVGAFYGVGATQTGSVSPSIFGLDNATNTTNLTKFINIQDNYWTGAVALPGGGAGNVLHFNTDFGH